jgi:hypothetical protein
VKPLASHSGLMLRTSRAPISVTCA